MSKKWSTAQGDCLEVLRRLGDNCLDSCVTDPPYGLSFMGKKWDYDVPSVEIWKEVFRVLKPGGYLLAFAGTRTQHRMAVNIEDAGFEIRDMIAWMYGQGFPKSLDVGKAIDKSAGAEREVVGSRTSAYGTETATGERVSRPGGGAGLFVGTDPKVVPLVSDEAVTDEAKQWEGWGTALKPAMEPITVARKPLEGTVAANVLKHGTGAINIDGCRVGYTTVDGGNLAMNPHLRGTINGGNGGNIFPAEAERRVVEVNQQGRFPANVIMDEEAGKVLDAQTGQLTSGKPGIKKGGNDGPAYGSESRPPGTQMGGFGDTGGASRFFYCPKTNKKDRGDGNNHPTVKPTDLMRYLCRLVTPPEGIVLDPFMGSGSTGKAAILEGFKFIGIEREAQYIEIAQKRLAAVEAA